MTRRTKSKPITTNAKVLTRLISPFISFWELHNLPMAVISWIKTFRIFASRWSSPITFNPIVNTAISRRGTLPCRMIISSYFRSFFSFPATLLRFPVKWISASKKPFLIVEITALKRTILSSFLSVVINRKCSATNNTFFLNHKLYHIPDVGIVQ